MKLRLYLGEQQAHILQTYQSLALVASAALGGKSKGKGAAAPSKQEDVIPQTKGELIAAFNSVFG